jgi:(4-(4-[2-(gamma-L-glutamylamino)ethyl]phenoxymethyl)furan-2-yl)methanamine synthase
MAPTILGLDIGGANLKAATADRRAVSVPFPLWKQPDKLPAALAELVAKFPDADELAVTMTGELCDCFETKHDGVDAIIRAVRFASGARPIHVWSTDGVFLNSEEAKQNHMKVAAANWHALATFAGSYVPRGDALLIDVGSTTTDVIPLCEGVPHTFGATDVTRLAHRELVYVGVRRTPVCAVYAERVCAELFATAQDVYVVLGLLPEEPDNHDTADGRPLTFEYSLARLARMLGGDRDNLPEWEMVELAVQADAAIMRAIVSAVRLPLANPDGREPNWEQVIIAGSGEFLARRAVEQALPERLAERPISLGTELGPEVSACAPAYAVAVLATERRP